MEKIYEKHQADTKNLIKNDYLNVYGGIADLLSEKSLIEIYKKNGKWPPKLRGFSEHYQAMQLNISESEKEIIKKLDDLAVEANRLLNEADINESAFLNLSIQASEICGRSDMVEIFRKRIKK